MIRRVRRLGVSQFNRDRREQVLGLFPTLRLERGVTIKGPLANLRLGRDVVIQTGCVLHLGGMAWCEDSGLIEIGDESVLSPLCVVYGAGPGGVHIGKKFDCGPGVGIFSSRTDYRRGPGHHVFAPVEIGDDVIVYANCVISPGVTVGSGAVIAAGSVVTSDVPPGSLCGGAPARVLRAQART
jgi:acetyltransferase-like isoleucine patch superfamily enzyme